VLVINVQVLVNDAIGVYVCINVISCLFYFLNCQIIVIMAHIRQLLPHLSSEKKRKKNARGVSSTSVTSKQKPKEKHLNLKRNPFDASRMWRIFLPLTKKALQFSCQYSLVYIHRNAIETITRNRSQSQF